MDSAPMVGRYHEASSTFTSLRSRFSASQEAETRCVGVSAIAAAAICTLRCAQSNRLPAGAFAGFLHLQVSSPHAL